MATRVTPEGLTRKQAEIGPLKARIDSWKALSKEKESALWKHIGPRIKEAKDRAEKDTIRSVVDGNDLKAMLAAGQAIAYEHIYNEVENTDTNIEKAQERISELRAQVQTAKEHDGIID